MRTILLAAAALLAVTVAGCGDEDPTTMADDDAPASLSLDDLDGRAFASVRVDGHSLVEGTRVRLGFAGEEVRADAGCNHLFGTLAVDGGAIVASAMGGTEMGCPDGLHEQDVWLTEFLTAGPQAVLDGDRLTLTRGDVVLEMVERVEEDAPVTDGRGDQPTSDGGSVVGSG